MNQLINTIDKEKDNRFKKTWLRLDKGSRLNRITLYTSQMNEIHDLDENTTKQLRTLLSQLFDAGILNKNKEIDYSSEEGIIVNIKNLHFNEETQKFIFVKDTKKLKSSPSKSKSNIERHFNRKKNI